MLKNHYSYQASSERMSSGPSTSRDSLSIIHTESIWDKQNRQIVLLVETRQKVTNEIDVQLRENRMILEAPLVSSYVKPLRTHKIEKENRSEFEDGLTVIGFSEIKLKSGYFYTLISSQLVDTNLIKVILGFRPAGLKMHN